jgi:hypothetical protein
MRGNYRIGARVDNENKPFAIRIPILSLADKQILIRGKKRAFEPCDYVIRSQIKISPNSPFSEFGRMYALYPVHACVLKIFC